MKNLSPIKRYNFYKNPVSNKNFGLTFTVVLFLLNLYFLLFEDSFIMVLFILFIFFLLSTLFFLKILTVPNFLWFKLGQLLGLIISPIFMTFIYFLFLTPYALLTKLFIKDFFNNNYNFEINSYWINRKDNPEPMIKQF